MCVLYCYYFKLHHILCKIYSKHIYMWHETHLPEFCVVEIRRRRQKKLLDQKWSKMFCFVAPTVRLLLLLHFSITLYSVRYASCVTLGAASWTRSGYTHQEGTLIKHCRILSKTSFFYQSILYGTSFLYRTHLKHVLISNISVFFCKWLAGLFHSEVE